MCMFPVELFILKYFFDRYPNMGAFQLVVAQRLCGIAILMLYYNVNLKKKTWDNLKDKPKKGLTFRSIQAAIAGIIKTIITKYISITLISIVSNMQPMFTVLIAYIRLGEKIDKVELLFLFICTILLIIMVWSGHHKSQEPIDWDEILMYVLLFGMVISSAAGTVALRTMKKFDETVILWYT